MESRGSHAPACRVIDIGIVRANPSISPLGTPLLLGDDRLEQEAQEAFTAMESKVTPLENRRINYVLIDHENVQPTDLALLDREDVRLWVFVGAGQVRISSELAIQMQAMHERAAYVRISGNGSNALDFHVAFYIGQLVKDDARGFFHIISRDTGFDPLVEHLKTRKVFACRSASISLMPLFRTAEVPAAAKPAAIPTVAKGPEKAKGDGQATASTLTTAAQRLARMKQLLKKMDGSKPATLTALKKHVSAQFQNKLKADDLDALIASLEKAGALKLQGTKVHYR